MKKLICFLFALLLPGMVLAQSQQVARHKTLGSVAAGSVTNSYTTLLSNTSPLRAVNIINNADCLVLISFNASTDHLVVPASSALSVDYATIQRYVNTNISLKYSGTACTTGSVYAEGVY